MKTFLKNFLRWTITITTGITLIVGLIVLKYDYIPANIVIRILAAGLVTALVTTIFFTYEPKKKVGKCFGFVFFLLHYLSLCIIMTIIGVSFGWFEATLSGILEIVLSVGAVYIFTVVISAILLKGDADKMNEALKKLDDNDNTDTEA